MALPSSPYSTTLWFNKLISPEGGEGSGGCGEDGGKMHRERDERYVEEGFLGKKYLYANPKALRMAWQGGVSWACVEFLLNFLFVTSMQN